MYPCVLKWTQIKAVFSRCSLTKHFKESRLVITHMSKKLVKVDNGLPPDGWMKANPFLRKVNRVLPNLGVK